jgi:hypothetical protein
MNTALTRQTCLRAAPDFAELPQPLELLNPSSGTLERLQRSDGPASPM